MIFPSTPQVHARPLCLVLILAALGGIGCAKKESALGSQPSPQDSRWWWLPKSDKYKAEVAQLPGAADFELTVGGLVVSEHGKTNDGEPKFTLEGYGFYSAYGPVRKSAVLGQNAVGDHFHGFTLEDGRKISPIVSGQILIPRDRFINGTINLDLRNFFEVEPFGDRFLLITINKNKGHQIAIIHNDDFSRVLFTGGFDGSRIEVGGKFFQRQSDDWRPWYPGVSK